jgi:type IV pilus assembly protein PilW
MTSFTPTRRAREGGFTLIELMIAATIGLVLTLVVAQLFIGSRRTYATTDEVSRMQEGMRYTYQLLTRTIHIAGYKSSPSTTIDAIFGATPVLAGVEGPAASFASDEFTVAYQGNSNGPGAADGSVVNCLGVPVTGGQMSVNTFSIQAGKNGANALFCAADGGTATEVVPDVDNMQVLYGVDTDANLIVDTYETANNVANMNNVRSVRVGLLFVTPGVYGAPAATTATYDVNGLNVGPFTDNKIRRVMTMTVNMRNRTP